MVVVEEFSLTGKSSVVEGELLEVGGDWSECMNSLINGRLCGETQASHVSDTERERTNSRTGPFFHCTLNQLQICHYVLGLKAN